MSVNKVVRRVVSISATILIILLVIFGLFKLGQYAYEFGYRVYAEEAVDEKPGHDVLVQISDDMTQEDIAALFKTKGLINDERLFLVQLKLSMGDEPIKSGAYTLNTSMVAQDMMDVMKNAQSEDEEESETSEDGE